MKKVLLALVLVSAMSASAQKLTKDCWSAGAYHMTATQGGANGKIEVTIYNNNNRDVVLQPTRTFLLDNQGSVSFSIDQPVRTGYRYAYARWFTKNEDGSYSVNYFHNAGTGDDGSYSGLPTASNECNTVLPIKFVSITAERIAKDVFRVKFEVAEASGINVYKVKLSTDGINYKEKAILFPKNTVSGAYEVVIKL